MKKGHHCFIGSQVFVIISYFLAVILKGENLERAFVGRFPWHLIFWAMFIFIGFLFDKFNIKRYTTKRSAILSIIQPNFVYAGIVGSFFLMTYQTGVSRILFFGTLGFVTLFELISGILIYGFTQAPVKDFDQELEELQALEELKARHKPESPKQPEGPEPPPEKKINDPRFFLSEHGKAIRAAITEEAGHKAFSYINEQVPLGESSVVLSVSKHINIRALPDNMYTTIINLQPVNTHGNVNRFFEAVNAKLPAGGIYTGCGETISLRRQRFQRRFTPAFGYIAYAFDYLFTRTPPKTSDTENAALVNDQKKLVMSRTEILGRLCACGFEIADERYVNGLLFFVARKVREPYTNHNPSYGPIISLKRIGAHGKVIGVYKMRTMYPYAEYLQHYVYHRHKLAEGGKFQNDFRISAPGALMRKLWIDELPMLINWFKGELKLVGVRPLSEHYFKLYTPEMQRIRIRFKPGLVPPFYYDLPTTLEEIMASEQRYLESYAQHPFRTDWNYFWRAFFNIVFRKARSN